MQRRHALRQLQRQAQQQRLQRLGGVLNNFAGGIHACRQAVRAEGQQQRGATTTAAVAGSGGCGSTSIVMVARDKQQLPRQGGKVGGVQGVDVWQAAPLHPGAKAAQRAERERERGLLLLLRRCRVKTKIWVAAATAAPAAAAMSIAAAAGAVQRI